MTERARQRVDAQSESDVARTLVRVSRSLIGIAISSVEEAGPPITVTQHRVLVLLSEMGELTVSQIALLTGVNQSNASRMVDRLQHVDLVTRRRAASDGRVVQVAVTTRGAEALDAVSRVREREISAVLGRMSDREARAAATALAAFDEAAKRHERRRLEDLTSKER